VTRLNIGDIEPALLEDWLRERYFTARIDISSSGVENYSLGDLRRMLAISTGELDDLVFRDSPSLGAEGLRHAVADRFAPGAADRVMITHGSSEGLFLALSAVVRPGDEVVVLSPVYQSLSSIPAALGATLRVWELRPEDDFKPDVGLLRKVLTPRTRAVVVNFPHNPTGTMVDPDSYAELLELVDAADCYLFWDSAFGELVYDRPPLPDPCLALDRCVSFGTLSKAYGLPGMRVGWCVAPPALLAEMIRLRDYVTLSTSPLIELIATAVLRRADEILAPRLATARANRTLLIEWAARHPDLVSLPVPAGGVCAFPGFPNCPDVPAVCDALLAEHGVLVVPGTCFGQPDRMRIGFGGPAGELAAGLARVADTVAAGSARARPA
jgi:capreomycidine synthase